MKDITLEPSECFMSYVLHSHKNGILDSISYSKEIAQYIYRIVQYKTKGDEVEKFDGAGKAIGIVFMRFPLSSIMNFYEHEIAKHIKINLQSNQ